MSHLAYFWSYTFVRTWVYIICGSVLAILVFMGVSAGVVSRRTSKRGKQGAFTIEQLNAMSDKKGGV